jgi:RNA-directed DNA polymerase
MVKETQEPRDEKPKAPGGSSGRNSRVKPMGASSTTVGKEVTGPGKTQLMEAVVERGNMLTALHRVESNKGAAGVDGMAVADLRAYLKEQWPEIRESLLSGSYKPKPVRRVEIPKPDGKGVRKLGIPTVSGSLDTAGSAPGDESDF